MQRLSRFQLALETSRVRLAKLQTWGNLSGNLSDLADLQMSNDAIG
jgi:hypothetical protein